MPDHLHLLLFITAPIKLHLGNFIGRMKIVSLGKEGELSRQMCLEMNALAAAICK